MSNESATSNITQTTTETITNNTKLYIPPHLQCPLSKNGKLMLDPVIVTGLQSNEPIFCERDAYYERYPNIKAYSPVKKHIITSNSPILATIKDFIKNHQNNLDIDKDLYYSQRLADELVSTFKSKVKNDSKFKELLTQDNRLLIAKLKDDKTLLELVCEHGTAFMIETTIQKLQDYFQSWESKELKSFAHLNCVKNDKGHSLILIILKRNNLYSAPNKTKTLKLLKDAFNLDNTDLQKILLVAINDDDSNCITDLITLGAIATVELAGIAIKNNKLKALKTLLTLNIFERNTSNSNSLEENLLDIAYNDERLEAITLLINSNQFNLNHLITKAVDDGKKSMVKFLLETYSDKINPNMLMPTTEKPKRNLLMALIEKNQLDNIALLLKYPTLDVDQIDNTGNTALHYLVTKIGLNDPSNNKLLITSFMEKGFNIKKTNDDQKTPLEILRKTAPQFENEIHKYHQQLKVQPFLNQVMELRQEIQKLTSISLQNKLIIALSEGNLEKTKKLINYV